MMKKLVYMFFFKEKLKVKINLKCQLQIRFYDILDKTNKNCNNIFLKDACTCVFRIPQ